MEKNQKILTIGVFIVLVAILICVCTPKIKQSLSVDKCLDKGGAWDYENKVCNLKEDVDLFSEKPDKYTQKIIDYVKAGQEKALLGSDIDFSEKLLIGHENRSLCYVLYPRQTIPEVEEFVNSEIVDFKELAISQDKAFKDFYEETGNYAASLIAHKIINFEVPCCSKKLLAYRFVVEISTGGTGMDTNKIFLFDRSNKKIIKSSELFKDEKALEKIAQFSEEIITKEIGKEALFKEGFKPLSENYQNIAFDEENNMIVYFDKYQVAAGARGLISATIPYNKIENLLSPQIKELLK